MDTSENTAMSGLSDLGLGVSIYDQQEFEADVMKQFDEEANRQAAEQQRKFAEKELSTVQREIRQIKTEVTALSRQITSLLSKPLCDVVCKLKQLKTSQEEKKIKLQELEKKEKELKERLSKGDFNDFRPPETDRLFSLPASTTDQADKLELIRTGLLTPFGSSSTVSNSSITHQERSHDHHVRKSSSPALSLADFDWLGITSRTGDKGKGKGKGPIKSKSTDKLSSTDQLESSSSTPFKNMDLSSNTSTHSSQYENESVVEHRNESENQPARYGSEDVDYRPESEGSDDSYVTDDELGGVVEKRKRKRELLSDESDDELIQMNWPNKKKSKVKRRGSGIIDDGDEEVYKTRMRQYKSSLSEEEEPPVEFDGGFKITNNIWQKLYRYQQTGVKWLWELHSQQAGGIMGDEMGLGKTIQIIAFLSGLKISNIRSHVTRELGLGPVLIVCPATVLHQWVMEFHTWYPPFRVAILHDTGSYEGSKVSLLNRIVNVNGVIVTTYAGLRLSHQFLLRYQWEYVILDEGHKIRNPDSEITLVCKQFSTPHRIILSGSPMQNNLRELWSLFDFVFPGKLGTLPVFMEQFSVPITLGGYINASKIQVETAYRCACILRDTINPYLLRRLKSDVKLQLPNKNEQVLFCRLTDYQRELYEDYIKGPEVEAMMSGSKWIFSGLVTLRKLCNHPDLVTNEYRKGGKGVSGGEGEGVAGGEGKSVAEGEGDDSDDEEFMTLVKKRKMTDNEITGDIEETYGYWRRSGKMIVIEALLRMWYEQKHKVLLFTQSKQMLMIFEKFVQSREYSYLTMDGSTSIGSRQTIIKNFNEDPSIFIFLLTTRVGGIGINLTGADRVVIYDPDWNPSTDTQARERAWRIGQTRPVTIYRLLTSGTIEEKIYHRQIFKQFLTNRVLRDPRQRRFFKSNDLYELFTLGSSDGPNKTETNVIFAGTGSEVKMPKKDKRRKKSKHAVNITSGEKHSTTSVVSEPLSSVVQEDNAGCSASAIDDTLKEKEKKEETYDSRDTTEKELSQEAIDALLSCQKKRKKSKKKKKKRNKHKKRDVEVDGHQITGLESMDIYNPGSEDEEDQITKKQDNIILRALFKKSGVQTAVQHDTIVNSGDPDYTIVESEANKVAQSAVRALKESRRQCQETRGSIQWGQPTWTGQHGTVGAPRFGESSKQTKLVENHFTGTGSQTGGSLNLSSSLLLQKMRSRNALTLPEAGQRHLHSNEQQELLRDLRSFIAHQCRQDGQATTDEILNKFGKRLSPSQSPMFRSMLHEICDFHRYHGDGVWTLKAEYR